MKQAKETLRRVTVFCGSALGADPRFRAEASALGAALGRAGLGLVYGGANCGLMGVLADAALAAGVAVYGVLPQALEGREIAHTGLTALERVATMHERKARMHELGDAILVLPGGYGTLDELFEAVTWAQLGLHRKPIVLIDTANYWAGLMTFLDTAVASGFLKERNRELIGVAAHADEALAMLAEKAERLQPLVS